MKKSARPAARKNTRRTGAAPRVSAATALAAVRQAKKAIKRLRASLKSARKQARRFKKRLKQAKRTWKAAVKAARRLDKPSANVAGKSGGKPVSKPPPPKGSPPRRRKRTGSSASRLKVSSPRVRPSKPSTAGKKLVVRTAVPSKAPVRRRRTAVLKTTEAAPVSPVPAPKSVVAATAESPIDESATQPPEAPVRP